MSPILTKARIAQTEGEAYDDFDDIAQSLFTNIVESSVRWSREGGQHVELSRYAMMYPDGQVGFVVMVVTDGESLAFHSFVTGSGPFDSVRCIALGDTTVAQMWPGVLLAFDDVTTFEIQLLGTSEADGRINRLNVLL